MKPLSPLICYYGMTSCDAGDIPDDDVMDPDSDILDMEPLVQPKPRYVKCDYPKYDLIWVILRER
jgi:hypothetical protein